MTTGPELIVLHETEEQLSQDQAERNKGVMSRVAQMQQAIDVKDAVAADRLRFPLELDLRHFGGNGLIDSGVYDDVLYVYYLASATFGWASTELLESV